MKRLLGLWLVLAATLPVFGQTVYVWQGGSHASPFNSWATAATNIQQAINVTAAGATVLLTNGAYGTTNEFVVSNAITVTSVNGPAFTTVYKTGGGYSRLFNLNNTNALLCGLTITNGSGGQGAQGVAITVSAGTVSNCVIAGCTPNRGSSVYLTGAGSRLTHSVIRDNAEAGNSGGCAGVKLTTGALMQYCLLTRNKSGSENNAISTVYMAGSATVQNCVVSNNSAYGPYTPTIALYLQAGDAVRNSLIVNNANRGVHMAGGTVDGCTVSRNMTYGIAGNGLLLAGGLVRNSILYHNGWPGYNVWKRDCVISAGAISNSCSPFIAGASNTTNAPLFRDPAAGDYTLLPGSPCLDAGTNLASLTIDLDGNPRPVAYSGAAAITDMGCYEMAAASGGVFRCGFTASAHEGVGSLSVTFTPAVAGESTAVTFAGWTFGDGATDTRTTLDSVSHGYSAGLYTVSLLVSNSLGQSASASIAQDIRVAPEAAFVSKTGSHTVPFDTWAKAATNVQAALDILLSETGEVRTVTVSNGVYDSGAEIVLNLPLRLASLNGPQVTTLNRSGGGSYRVISLNYTNTFLTGFTVTNGNAGAQEGSGIWVAPGTVSNCVIAGCTASRGSTLYMSGTNALMTHSILRNNADTGNSGGCGGAKLLNGARLLYSSVIRSTPGSEANGISALVMSGKSLASHCVISNCAMSANKASYVAVVQSDSILRNCLITDNAGRGVQATGGTVENCTITRNSMYGDIGNGMSLTSSTSRNCIVWNNGTDNSKNMLTNASLFEYGDTAPALAGTGNKTLDPLFLAPAAGNFRLDPGSQLINAGTNLAWMTGAVDLDGSNRVTGAAADMGCYEASESAGLACNFDAPVTEGLTTLTAVFTAEATGGNTTIVNYAWTFGDSGSASGADKKAVTNLYTTPGYYTVSLTVQNDGSETASRTKTNFIYVAPAVAYVSTNGSHQAPFMTWDTAATNLQAAVTVARVLNGSATLVLVSNGVYGVGIQLDLLKGITVSSVNGADVTAITRTGSASRLVWVNHADALLDGFTISNGFYTGNSSGGMLMNTGTVRNCVFTANIGNRMSGALELTGGTVSNCLFRRNVDNGQTLGCGAVAMSGGLLANCLLLENRGGTSPSEVGALRITGGEARSCVIVSNTAAIAEGTIGGVAVSGSGLLRDCLVAANQGKGVSVAGGSVVNCTVVRNSSNGVDLISGGVTNTIITDNNFGNGDLAGTGTVYAFCCSPALSGNGNVAGAPLFVSAGSGYGTNAVTGDYRPGKGSPCLDAGYTFPWAQDGLDLAGGPRLLNKAMDIGAYESLKPPSGTLLMIR